MPCRRKFSRFDRKLAKLRSRRSRVRRIRDAIASRTDSPYPKLNLVFTSESLSLFSLNRIARFWYMNVYLLSSAKLICHAKNSSKSEDNT